MKPILILLLPVLLFAQQPAQVEGVVIEYFPDDSVRISWEPVLYDTAGNPICISMYKIYCYPSPRFPGEQLPCGITLDQYHSITMEITPAQLAYSPRWYYRVTATEGG